MKPKHKKFDLSVCGFFISSAYPFIGASPDGIISWTYSGLNIDEYICKPEACLEMRNGLVRLKLNHPYYFQVQCQMGVAGYKWCDLFLCTSKYTFTVHISFNETFWLKTVTKAMSFYEQVILPELFLHTITNKMDKHTVVKDVKRYDECCL